MESDQPFLQHARVAVAFLTRVPVRHGDEIAMGRIARWFPVVGAGVGLFSAAVLASSREILSNQVSAVLAVMAGVLVTGGFHHDGLADSADGLVGGWTPEQRLQILKDSRHGTYGVLALVLQVVLQVSVIADLDTRQAVCAVVLMHCLGRAAAVSVMHAGKGITEGLGANYVAGVTKLDMSIALGLGVVFGVVVAGWQGLVPFVVALVVARLAVSYAVAKIGGIVGDVLGGVEQVGESAVLLTVMSIVGITGGFGW